MKNVLFSALFCAVLSFGCAFANDWQSFVGPDGVTRIIIEAEDMDGVDWKNFGGVAPEWRVGRAGIDHYQCNIFGGHWQSRTRTAMTDAGENKTSISKPIAVPASATYKLWVKYECPPEFNYAFDVVVRKGGTSGQEVFRRTYGLINSEKHFCFTNNLTKGSLYWAWGIDHDAAEGYDVSLETGTYTVVIEKTNNPEPAGMRSIDVLMLTNDTSPISAPRFSRYPLLDELRRANHVFMRYRVPAEYFSPLKVTWNRWGKRYNDFYSPFYTELVRAYGSDGERLADTDLRVSKYGQIQVPVKPGDTSVWLDIGPCLNVENAATFNCNAVAVDANGAKLVQQPAFIPYIIDIALAPYDTAIVKSFSIADGEIGGMLAFLLQPDLKTEDGLKYSRKLADVFREIAVELDKESRSAGKLPLKMRFYGGTGWVTGYPDPEWAWLVNMDLRRAMGLNTMPGSALSNTQEDYAKAKAYYQQKGDVMMKSGCHHHSQNPEEIAKKIKELGTEKEFHYLSFGDEIGLPAVNVSDTAMLSEFHEYIKAEGVTPESLGLSGWDNVKPLNTFSADVAVQIGVIPAEKKNADINKTLKRLYWHSVRFRTKKGVEDFAQKTKHLAELLGPSAHTSANLGGMHPFYWVHQSSFIEAFKHNAMSLAWTEDYDYCMPETSRLVAEYLAGYLKCGAKYNNQRMMMYCMPHYPGQTPEHLIQNAVLEWGQNVKDIDWFAVAPDGFATENYVNCRDGMPTFRTMRLASDMAGKTENWLESASSVKANVAMLLSEASDLWEVDGQGQWSVTPTSKATNAFQEERKNTYYVLRNAGYRVDLITEEDVQEGLLDAYKVLYIGGENMERATAKVIDAWVKKGGILYASAGSARKDEYDEPMELLDNTLGRGKQTGLTRYNGALRSKIELPLLKPLDEVKLSDDSVFKAYAVKESFEPKPVPFAAVALLGFFVDSSPAFVSAVYSKGRAYYVGTMPGEAWAKKALPVIPCGKGGPEKWVDGSPRYPSFEPVDFDAVAGGVILKPLLDAGIRPDVRIDKLNVVTNRLAGDSGTVITVVNLGMQQKGIAETAKIEIDSVSKPSKVWSYYFQKGLETEYKDGTLTLTLPKLELVDIVILER